MKLLWFLPSVLFLSLPARAAVTIIVQPGPTAGTTLITLTQTSPPITLDVAGLSGFASGISIPNSMFNIPGLGPGESSDIFGNLANPLATVTEAFSGQSFQLSKLQVSANPSIPSLLGFDSVFVIPSGASSIRFEAVSAGPVPTNIGYAVLVPGIHSVEDTLFGTVTVTVIPEASTCLLLAATLIPSIIRRKRSRPLPVR